MEMESLVLNVAFLSRGTRASRMEVNSQLYLHPDGKIVFLAQIIITGEMLS